MKLADYECITTFWEDFSIAEASGTRAILDTYNRAIREWGDNIKYMTELVIVLTHKIWQWYEKDAARAAVYDTLRRGAEYHVLVHFEGEDIRYYTSQIKENIVTKRYKIKPEYYDLWGAYEGMDIVDSEELLRLAYEWEMTIEELMEQVEEL